MPKKSFAEHSLEWFHLANSAETDLQEPFLKELILELRHVRETMLALETERLALIARKQQITKDMNALKSRGRAVAARVRSGVLTQYGWDSERLTVHGMKPRRRKTRVLLDEKEALERLAEDPTS
jgi:hypothetical protein